MQNIKDDANFGPNHDLTVDIAAQVGQLYRIFGRYSESLELEQELLAHMTPTPHNHLRRLRGRTISQPVIGSLATSPRHCGSTGW